MMYMAACSGWRRPSKKPWLCQLACMMCPTTCSRAAISQVMQELRKSNVDPRRKKAFFSSANYPNRDEAVANRD